MDTGTSEISSNCHKIVFNCRYECSMKSYLILIVNMVLCYICGHSNRCDYVHFYPCYSGNYRLGKYFYELYYILNYNKSTKIIN